MEMVTGQWTVDRSMRQVEQNLTAAVAVVAAADEEEDEYEKGDRCGDGGERKR
jgi:hypothetical protein